MRHFYAVDCPYGISTISEGNTVHVFETKRDRDTWVDEDVFDGNYHRMTVLRETAKRICRYGYQRNSPHGNDFDGSIVHENGKEYIKTLNDNDGFYYFEV